MSQVVIGDILPYTQATATAGQTVFGTNWTANAASDVVVYVTPSGSEPNDVTQILSYPSQYSVAFIGGQQQVQVTLVSGASLGDTVTVTRQTPADRMNLYSNTNFLPSMLNNDFGILTLVDQQAQLVDQKIGPRYNYSATIVDVVDTILPILGANETWVKNPSNTGFIPYELPSSGIAPADATYVTITDETSTLPNSVNFSALSPGIVAFTGSDFVSNPILGTTHQIDVVNATGVAGSVTLSFPDNMIIPGTGSVGLPGGTTAERVITASGTPFRYNSTFDSLEFYSSGTWSLVNDDTDGNILPGVAGQLGYYQADGVTISPLATQNDGVVITDHTGIVSILAGPGATGRIFQSNSALPPAWSTFNWPTAAGSAGSLVISDGTNKVNSTSIWPNTVGAAGKIIRSDGADNVYSTSTFADTYAINTLLYASAANQIVGLATALNSVLITDGTTGIPSLSQTLPSDVQNNITLLGTLAEALDMGTHLINNVVDPVSPQDAATKNYIDNLVADFSSVFVARLASTTALTVTYANGSSGVGATLTNAGVQAALTLDGVAAVVNDLVLIKDQASGLQNGYYVVTNIGSGATNWVLTRSTKYDLPAEIQPGDLFVITAGSTEANTTWIQTATVTAVGVDSITFQQYSVALPIPISQGGTGATNAADARTNLGLGTMAVQNANAVAITGGTIVGLTDFEADNIKIDGNAIQHLADLNNQIVFGTDTQSFETGGSSRMDISDSGFRLGAANSRVTTILDQDTMSSDSDTALATQQSIKAYVDHNSPNAAQPNLIIGGDFGTNPWQRSTSRAAAGNNVYTADMFSNISAGSGVVTVQKTADAPTVAQAGVYTGYCLDTDVTTADASIGATDIYGVRYVMEGFDWSYIAQKAFTMSFWVKSTKTGTFCIGFNASQANKSYVAEYTVNASDTWEYKTITITASPSGAGDNFGAGYSMVIFMCTACGSTYQTTANSWQTGFFAATSNQVNAMDSASNNFKLALVKIEPGSIATPFPIESYETTWGKCQRYYQKSFQQAVAPAQNTNDGLGCVYWQSSVATQTFVAPIVLPVRMAVTPTVVTYNYNQANANWRDIGNAADRVASIAGSLSDSTVPIVGAAGAANASNLIHWTADASQ